MSESNLNEPETKKLKINQKSLLIVEEEMLADKLKQICNDKGHETNSTKSAAIFHKLAHNYQNRIQVQHNNSTSIMINLIKSAALYNAAIKRSPQNVEKLQADLKLLCADILNFAGAEQTSADLIQEAEKVKKEIQNMRSFVNEKIFKDTDRNLSSKQEQEKINHIKNLQIKITQDYTQIMANLSLYCEKVMGKAPCKFTVIGMGSLARKEITPYSDFEHIIVLEKLYQQEMQKENVLNYFRWFSVIFQTVVLNLQETILPSVSIYSLNNKESKHGDWYYDAFTTRGISFDGMMPHACKFPLGRQQFTETKTWKTELIKPVNEMLKYLTLDEDLKNGYHLKDMLTKICFIYGDKIIFDNFELSVHEILKEEDKKIQIDTIKGQMLKDLDKFAARSTLLELLPSKELNLKQVMYRSTTLFVSALGRAYNIQATSSFDIIEQLEAKGKIKENTKQRLMHAVAIACEIRLKWYMKCQRQSDVVQSNTNKNTAIQMLLNLVTKKNIISYFQTAYALQCDISKKFKLDKKYFYSNPTLFNSSLYYCLGEKQKFIALTQEYKNIDNEKKTRLFPFDDCMKEFNDSKINSCHTFTFEQNSGNKSILIEAEKEQQDNLLTAEYFKEFGIYLWDINKYDEALEYFKKEENILTKILGNYHSIKEPYIDSFPNKPTLIETKLTTTVHVLNFEKSTIPYSKNDIYENNQLTKLSNCQLEISRCLMKMNKFTAALDHLKRSLAIYERITLGVDSDPKISETLHEIGRCLMNMNQLTEALDYLKQSLAIDERISLSVNSDPKISVTLHEIGCCLMKMNQLTEALDYLKRSLAIYERISLGVDSDPKISATLHTIGCCLMNMNQLTKALNYLKRSLAIKKQVSLSFDSDPKVSVTLHAVGCCLMNMNQFTEALDYLKRSLAIKEQISLGVDSDPKISVTLHEIGRCLMNMNQLTEALDYLKRSLAIKERISLGVDSDPKVSATLHEIGRCLMNMNQLTEALDYLKRSLAIKKKISRGVDSDPKVSVTLHAIGYCLMNMNQLTEALDYLKRSLAIKKRISLGFDSDPKVSETLHEIGCCLMNMNQLTEALDYLKQSLAIYERISRGVDSDLKISVTLHTIGRCLMNMNQLTEALDYLKRSLAIKKRISRGVDSDPKISVTLHVIGCCLTNMNQFTEALDYLKLSLAIYEEISLGVDLDPKVSETLHEIGRCLMNMNQLTEALDYLKRSLAITERISLGVDSDPKISVTLHTIGCCLMNMNQFTEALDYLKRSLAIKKRISRGVDSDPKVSETLHEIDCCLTLFSSTFFELWIT